MQTPEAASRRSRASTFSFFVMNCFDKLFISRQVLITANLQFMWMVLLLPEKE